MNVINPSEDRTFRTVSVVVHGLAAPSQGSEQVAAWKVSVIDGGVSPVHVIDKDQVWVPITGTFDFTIDGETERISAGQAVVVPAGSVRQFRSTGEPLEALVAMQAGALVSIPGTEGAKPVPWAV
jgi:mannose-6-phosphate isomerase-like protein (cupin superfamily)